MRHMAAIKDVPVVMKSLGVKAFLLKVLKGVGDDGVFTWASALAYSWVFALFPMVIAILTLVPYLPWQTREKARNEIANTVYASMGGDAAKTIMTSIDEVVTQTKGGLLSIGLLLAIWGASGGMTMTMSALDKAYKVKSDRVWWKHRLMAIGLTLAVIFLVLCVLFLLPIGGAIVDHLKNIAVLGEVAVIALNILRYVIAVGMLLGAVALMYYFGPNIKQKWQAVTPGAIVAVVVWIALGIGFGIYVQNFGNFNKTYGALGAAIILLLFCYLSSAVLLIGAEINSAIDFAVLGVEPGCTDFTMSACDAQTKDALMPASGPAAEAREQIDRGKSSGSRGAPGRTGPMVAAPAGWWKWAAASIAGGWLANRIAGVPQSHSRTP
jgi:membrane protein